MRPICPMDIWPLLASDIKMIYMRQTSEMETYLFHGT